MPHRVLGPCWPCNHSAGVCCLPAAHILGVSKCGTTDLYNRLTAHPGVLKSRNKGPHFWDEGHYWDWYIRLFDVKDKAVAKRGIFIDASSNTLTFSGIGVRGSRFSASQPLLPEVLAWVRLHLYYLYYCCLPPTTPTTCYLLLPAPCSYWRSDAHYMLLTA